jgi:nitrile hydratase
VSAPAISVGDAVRVRDDYPPGHIRTPVYVRGKRGAVIRRHGEFANPERAAYGLPGPRRALFKVRFAQRELWADYAGSPSDTVDLDIYEHWLLPETP